MKLFVKKYSSAEDQLRWVRNLSLEFVCYIPCHSIGLPCNLSCHVSSCHGNMFYSLICHVTKKDILQNDKIQRCCYMKYIQALQLPGMTQWLIRLNSCLLSIMLWSMSSQIWIKSKQYDDDEYIDDYYYFEDIQKDYQGSTD